MIQLEQPSIAVNDPRVATADGKHRTRYHMWRTWDLSRKHLASRERIISYVAILARGAGSGNKIKNLIINCHGGPGVLQLGQGFGANDVGLFYAWEGLFDAIWLVGCRVARDNGRYFCGDLAFATGAHVLAGTELHVSADQTYPYGYVSEFEGLVLMFEPEHGRVAASCRNPSAWQGSDGLWHPSN